MLTSNTETLPPGYSMSAQTIILNGMKVLSKHPQRREQDIPVSGAEAPSNSAWLFTFLLNAAMLPKYYKQCYACLKMGWSFEFAQGFLWWTFQLPAVQHLDMIPPTAWICQRKQLPTCLEKAQGVSNIRFVAMRPEAAL